MNFNTWIGAGNLVRDPEVVPVGQSRVGKFTLAISRSFKSGDEWKEKTTFIDCETWNDRLIEKMSKLSKGAEVLVRGSLEQDRWDSDDGPRTKHKIVIFELRQSRHARDAQAEAIGNEADDSAIEDDDIPF